ncbi:hypothetical protein F5X68DRAFT_209015 [Plectosphaerella plurivora]|uniref:Uncharacterized protein n=1 Tax=Plectosphaerella plurivora TaxID=936078 RepID=A0A9P8VCI5_9PEZI|nr:hypothetical protein F5X68DRAFT_209015 [Plectosphaerella plurivora]
MALISDDRECGEPLSIFRFLAAQLFSALCLHAPQPRARRNRTDRMPLSLLIGFAGVFGVSEGIKASQAKGRREEHRSRKNNLKIHCLKSSQFSPYLEGRSVVLSGDRVSLTS